MSLFAASYDQPFYGGEYQGVAPAVRWSNQRFGVAASLPTYRLVENGRTLYGIGDVNVNASVRTERDSFAGGFVLDVTAPTGERRDGLGMGHPMVMPAVFASYALGRTRLAMSTGYGQQLASAHHEHGLWPIVAPMNASELTWGASGDVTIARAFAAGARVMGAVPLGDGTSRVVAGLRTVWTTDHVETGFELQLGLAGDPFRVRGVAETTLRF